MCPCRAAPVTPQDHYVVMWLGLKRMETMLMASSRCRHWHAYAMKSHAYGLHMQTLACIRHAHKGTLMSVPQGIQLTRWLATITNCQ